MPQHLVNHLPHARNQKVTVSGSEYEIDNNGVMRDVKDEDAERLLLNRQVWGKHDPRNPVTHPMPQRISLVDDQGRHFFADNSSTRAQVSGSPLQSDHHEKNRDITRAVDSAHSTPSMQPLISEDRKVPIPQTPSHMTASQHDAHVDFAAIRHPHKEDALKQPLADNPPLAGNDAPTTAVVPKPDDAGLTPTGALANQPQGPYVPGPTEHDIADGELGDEDTTPDETGVRKRGRHPKK